MKLRLELIIVLLASLTLPVCASAQVTFFGAIKGIFYRQTKDNIVPKKDGTYSLHAFATTTSAGQADSFTVSAVAKLKLLADGVNFSGEKFFKSEAAMNAAFPAGGSYLFTAVGGSLGGQSDSIPVFSNDYPAIAYLPGEMLREVSGIDSKADFILDLAFSSEGAASTNVNFAIYTTSGEQALQLAKVYTGRHLAHAVAPLLTCPILIFSPTDFISRRVVFRSRSDFLHSLYENPLVR
jgi:hypothetical protein